LRDLTNADKKFLWDGIPKDRNDEGCMECGGGHLTFILNGGFRKLDNHHTQVALTCAECDNVVIMIDEHRDQDCPMCHSPSVFKISQIREIGTYISAQDLYDIKRLLEEGVDDYWWTCRGDGDDNFLLINRLRKLVCLEEISEKELDEKIEYWQNM